MARVFHIVGVQGSGKSMQAKALSKYFEAQGLQCAGVDDPKSEFITDRAEALTQWPNADVIFIEHAPGKPFPTEPGDTIINLEVIRSPR